MAGQHDGDDPKGTNDSSTEEGESKREQDSTDPGPVDGATDPGASTDTPEPQGDSDAPPAGTPPPSETEPTASPTPRPAPGFMDQLRDAGEKLKSGDTNAFQKGLNDAFSSMGSTGTTGSKSGGGGGAPGGLENLQNMVNFLEKLKDLPPDQRSKAAIGLGIVVLLFGILTYDFSACPWFFALVLGVPSVLLARSAFAQAKDEDTRKLAKGALGTTGLAVVVGLSAMVFGGPETWFFDSEVRGEWYATGTCDSFQIERSSATGQLWYLPPTGKADAPASDEGALGKNGKNGNDGKGKAAGGKGKSKGEAQYAKADVAPPSKELGENSDTGNAASAMGEVLEAAMATPARADSIYQPDGGDSSSAADPGPGPGRVAAGKVKERRQEIASARTRIEEIKEVVARWQQLDVSLEMGEALVTREGSQVRMNMYEVSANGEDCRGELVQDADGMQVSLTSGSSASICQDHVFRFTRAKGDDCGAPPTKGEADIAALVARIETLESEIVEINEEERERRNTPGSGVQAKSYPHACNDVDPEIHFEIEGKEGQCLPTSPAWWMSNAKVDWKTEDVPNSYSDDNDFALLGTPSTVSGESTKLGSADIATARQAIRARTYTTTKVDCDYTFVEPSRRLAAECTVESSWGDPSMYVNGSPYVSQSRECETECLHEGSGGCGSCSSDSDCELGGLFFDGCPSGCDQSRCTSWGRCTSCPRDCETTCYSEFETKGIGVWKLSITVPEDRIAEAQALTSASNERLLYTPSSVYRKVFTSRERSDTGGEWTTEVDHDS
ncbi:MAG: hypothetical protein QGG40_08025, partial [Myxococcota bacterium]|nr:hypothetical protein [Myxococcota bacterium]